MTFKKLFTSMIPAGLIVATLSAPAFAANCTPTCVVWNNQHGGEVQIVCGGTTYYADVNYSGYSVNPVDTLKSYLSLGETALVSGKTLFIIDDGTSRHNITQLNLNP